MPRRTEEDVKPRFGAPIDGYRIYECLRCSSTIQLLEGSRSPECFGDSIRRHDLKVDVQGIHEDRLLGPVKFHFGQTMVLR